MRAWACAFVLAGCFEAKSIVCDNGALCPSTLACTEQMAVPCADPADVDACASQAVDTACTRSTGEPGLCFSGHCGPCDPDTSACRYREWTAMTSPVTTSLNSVWAASPTEVYAVGDDGVVARYDGSQWSVAWRVIDGATSLTEGLVGVWVGGDELVVVDGSGDVYEGQPPAAVTKTPNSETLARVWGAANDVVVVGASLIIGESNGAAWTWRSPAGLRRFNDVWGTGSSVFAVARGEMHVRQNGSWSVVPGPNTTDTLAGVWGSDDKNLIVVGNAQDNATAVIYRFRWTTDVAAGTWEAMTVPAQTPSLRAVWGAGADEIYAVGRGTVVRFDGASWTRMTTPDDTTELKHVSGSGHDAFAVGGNGAIWRISPE